MTRGVGLPEQGPGGVLEHLAEVSQGPPSDRTDGLAPARCPARRRGLFRPLPSVALALALSLALVGAASRSAASGSATLLRGSIAGRSSVSSSGAWKVIEESGCQETSVSEFSLSKVRDPPRLSPIVKKEDITPQAGDYIHFTPCKKRW